MPSLQVGLRTGGQAIAIVALFLIMLLSPRVSAAATLVQVNSTTGSSSPTSLSYSTTPSSGDLLVAICSANAAATITGPSGFSTAINESGNPAQGIFYKTAVGTEGSISCSFSAGSTFAIQIYEYSGIENVSPLDAVNTTTSAGTTSPGSSGAVTTNNANDLLVASLTSDTNTAIGTWTNSFTQETQGTVGGNPSKRMAYASADLSAGSTGSYSTSPPVASGTNWRGQIAAFKIAPAQVFSVDIVNSSGTPISSPSVSMSTVVAGFSCQTTSGTLGVSAQKIRVTNTTPADSNGWTLTIGASSSNWSDGSGHSYSYNDSSGSPAGCTNGQLSVNPTAASITPEASPEYGCTNTGVSAYSSATSFTGSSQATLATAGSTSSHYCYWDITGITLSQKIPAKQHSGTYSINLTVTLTAQ